MRKFGNFTNKINTRAYTINAAFLDERALNALTAEDFKQIAVELQKALTDQKISQAIKRFPPEVYKLIGEDIASCLKNRRQDLVRSATEYYRLLAKRVVVAGSDERELFQVNRLPHDLTAVKVFQILPSDSVGRLLYHRIFKKNETQELILHGLAGDDIFKITGKVKTGIRISLNGGLGEDTFLDASTIADRKKETVVYDTKKGNNITWTAGMIDKTSSDISVHNYDREGY